MPGHGHFSFRVRFAFRARAALPRKFTVQNIGSPSQVFRRYVLGQARIGITTDDEGDKLGNQ